MNKVYICEYCGEATLSSIQFGTRYTPYDNPLWHPCPEMEKASEKYKDLWHFPASEADMAGAEPEGGALSVQDALKILDQREYRSDAVRVLCTFAREELRRREREGAGGSRDKPHGGTNKGGQPDTGLLINAPPLSFSEAIEVVQWWYSDEAKLPIPASVKGKPWDYGIKVVHTALRMVLDAAETLDEARRTGALRAATGALEDWVDGCNENRAGAIRVEVALLRRLNGEEE